MTPGRTLVGPTLRDGFSGALIFGGVANRSGVVSFGRRVGMVPLCGQPLTGAMDSAKKKTRSCLPRPATDVWIQTCRTSHPYGTAWNLFLSLGEPPFVRDWARAAFSYPSLPSCGEIVWPAWLPPRCLHTRI